MIVSEFSILKDKKRLGFWRVDSDTKLDGLFCPMLLEGSIGYGRFLGFDYRRKSTSLEVWIGVGGVWCTKTLPEKLCVLIAHVLMENNVHNMRYAALLNKDKCWWNLPYAMLFVLGLVHPSKLKLDNIYRWVVFFGCCLVQY